MVESIKIKSQFFSKGVISIESKIFAAYYIYPNQRKTSFRLATIMSNIRMPKPIYSALIRKFSLGLRPVIISYNKNSTCPPSNAGMGSMFMKARIMLRKAVMRQNIIQSHVGGNRLPIAPKPPNDLAPSAVNTYLRSSTYPRNIPKP